MFINISEKELFEREFQDSPESCEKYGLTRISHQTLEKFGASVFPNISIYSLGKV